MFFYVKIAQAKLKSALLCKGINTLNTHNHSQDAPKWKHDDVVAMMKMLTSSRNGYVTYDEFLDKLGEEHVDSLIPRRFLHLRPTHEGSYDIADAPAHTPIVTAESPCELFEDGSAKLQKHF